MAERTKEATLDDLITDEMIDEGMSALRLNARSGESTAAYACFKAMVNASPEFLCIVHQNQR